LAANTDGVPTQKIQQAAGLGGGEIGKLAVRPASRSNDT
jgi:hypothetical protein